MRGIKRSVKAKQDKLIKKELEQIRAVVRNSIKSYELLKSLIVEGNPEETYYRIKDFMDSVQEMVSEFNKEQEELNKKGKAD